MKAWFENLNPSTKRWVVLGAVIAGLMLVVSLFVGRAEKVAHRSKGDTVVTSVLNDRSTRDIGIDAMAARINQMESEIKKKSTELDQTQQELKKTRDAIGVSKDVARQLANLKEQLVNIKKANSTLQKKQQKLDDDVRSGNLDMPKMQKGSSSAGVVNGSSSNVDSTVSGSEVSPQQYFKSAPVPKFGDQRTSAAQASNSQSSGAYGKSGANSQGSAQSQSSSSEQKISLTDVTQAGATSSNGESDSSKGGNESDSDTSGASVGKDKGKGIYIPAGSLMTGTLITGLDAPTGQSARRDPFPVLVRLQKDAILPNSFSADVKGCVMILSGYGDLSSERVYLRTEGISCIRNDGKSIEAKVAGYATGEDGKAGMRGRLVTKQGQMIARSLVAGFFGAMGNAFNVQPVPTIDTTGQSNNVRYLNAFSGKAVQGGVVSGAGNALNKVADFWLKMANSIFPVLELDAGRQMDIVLIKGADLKLM